MATPDDAIRQDASKSLERMQRFDTGTLPQTNRLGHDLNFADVVPHADRLVRLYGQITLTVLEDLPAPMLTNLRDQANADFSRFDQILKFSANQGSPQNVRDNFVTAVRDAYQQTFTALHPVISYSASKAADFKGLERDGRAAVQAVADNAAKLMAQITDAKKDADEALAAIRKVAAEQGVSQQAFHFAEAANSHARQARNWLIATSIAAIALLAWAFVGLFLHKWALLTPTTTYESVQFALSKVLVFAVLSFAAYLCAKNFLSHMHNAIVNKHRQNALVTYKALVEAAGEKANRDIVLTQAAACIFSPQPTGYTGGHPVDGATAKSVVELLGKPISGT